MTTQEEIDLLGHALKAAERERDGHRGDASREPYLSASVRARELNLAISVLRVRRRRERARGGLF